MSNDTQPLPVEDVVTEEAPTPGGHPITEADPEGDGLDSGQTTADTVGDVLGI